MDAASGNRAVERVKAWVAKHLTSSGLRFEETEHDHVVFVYGDDVPGQPLEISVSCIAWGDDDEHASIVFRSIVLAAAEPSTRLHEYVATHQPQTIGKFRVHTGDDGEAMVVYEHQMLADHQDDAEIERAFDVAFALFVGQSKAAEMEYVDLSGEVYENEAEIDRLYGGEASAQQIEYLHELLGRQAVGLRHLARMLDMVAESDLPRPTMARIVSVVAKATDDLLPRVERLIESD